MGQDDLDAVGLLKVDVLALGMLSAIRRCLDLVGQQRSTAMRMQDIPREDTATYDLVVEVAIVRPGPIQGAWCTLT